MTKRQLFLVRKALRRIEAAEIARLDARPAVEWVPTQKYTAAMQKLLAQDKKRARSLFYGVKKRTIIGLIAAIIALLLTATACVFHREIKDFFIQVTEKGTIFETEISSSEVVDYEMSWVPEGYVFSDLQSYSSMKRFTWTKDKQQISFIYASKGTETIILDTEGTSYQIADVDGKKVYYVCKYNTYSLIWMDSDTSFDLHCPADVSWEDIERMIRSIVPIGE